MVAYFCQSHIHFHYSYVKFSLKMSLSLIQLIIINQFYPVMITKLITRKFSTCLIITELVTFFKELFRHSYICKCVCGWQKYVKYVTIEMHCVHTCRYSYKMDIYITKYTKNMRNKLIFLFLKKAYHSFLGSKVFKFVFEFIH